MICPIPLKNSTTSSMAASKSFLGQVSNAITLKVASPPLSSTQASTLKPHPFVGVEHLFPFFENAINAVKKKDVMDIKGRTLVELINTLQFCFFKLSYMVTNYKAQIKGINIG